ncbi:PorP/SprF family type IX secretion system membrane protein [Chitinophagaceae bacterium LWZ2-11]
MKKFFLWGMLLASGFKASAQDLNFSQFFQVPLLRNPALAGLFDGDVRVTAVYRNQWQSVTVPFQTSALSAEFKFPIGRADDYLTLGTQFTLDEAGDVKLKRVQVMPVINFHKSLSGDNDNYLSMAFMGGAVTSQFDASKIRMDDQYQNGSFDPNNPSAQTFDRTSITYWDAATGLSFSSSLNESTTYYVGVGMFHFNKPKIAFYANNSSTTLQDKYVFNFGLTTATSELNRLVMFADYYVQGGSRQFLAGALYGTDLVQDYDSGDKSSIYFGAFYRWKDAFIPVVKLDYYQFAASLSYDVNVSQLNAASQWRGGFEMVLSYRAKLNNRNNEAERVKCVKFVF